MPAGMVRPRASQVPKLTPDALATYQDHGWQVSELGNVGTTDPTGPCARCRAPCVRYGPAGGPLCDGCN